jgi:hypothetical protein
LHYWTRERWGAFREAANEFIKEFFGRDLEVHWVATLLDEGIDKSESEYRNMRVSVVYKSNGSHRCFPRGISLLLIDQLGQF